MTGSRYRKGMIPSKKFHTEMGGIGARSASIRNIILAQATPKRPVPAPPTTSDSSVNLFNIYSFGNIFDGKAVNGFPDKKLAPKHWSALIAASVRWKNLISFNSDLLNVIKTMYKDKFGKDWKGYELLGVNNSYTGKIAGASPILFKGTKIPYGFVLAINTTTLINGLLESDGTFSKFEQKNIEDVFAHELGHVLGLCNVLEPEYIVIPPTAPNKAPDGSWATYYKQESKPDYKFIVGGLYGPFPATYLEHYKDINSAVTRAIGMSPYIALSEDGKHWSQTMIQHEMWSWDPPSSSYRKVAVFNYGNFYNDLMAPGYNPAYANTEHNFLISRKSLKYLTEARVDGHRAYNEISPGASEVKSTIKYENAGSTPAKPDYTYILIGTRCVIVPGTKGINGGPSIITVEGAMAGEDAVDAVDAAVDAVDAGDAAVDAGDAGDAGDAAVDAADAVDAAVDAVDAAVETDTYNVIYPPGYIGERDDDEILRIVASHKRLLNDPSFVANTIQCCSGHSIEGA